MRPLDLDQPRDLRALFGITMSLWVRHFPVFFTLAALVVVPVDLLVDGLWAGTLGDSDADRTTGPTVASAVADWLLVPALVTAMHVVAVQDAGAGRRPTIRRSLAATARMAGPVLAVVLLYLLGCAIGLALLVVPGLWFAVAGYFGAQAVVVEGHRPIAALRRSIDLVRYQWFRVLGIQLALSILIGFVLSVVASLVASAISLAFGDEGIEFAVFEILFGTAGSSVVALLGTLLFFDLRARDPEAQVE